MDDQEVKTDDGNQTKLPFHLSSGEKTLFGAYKLDMLMCHGYSIPSIPYAGKSLIVHINAAFIKKFSFQEIS